MFLVLVNWILNVKVPITGTTIQLKGCYEWNREGKENALHEFSKFKENIRRLEGAGFIGGGVFIENPEGKFHHSDNKVYDLVS